MLYNYQYALIVILSQSYLIGDQLRGGFKWLSRDRIIDILWHQEAHVRVGS